MKYLVLARRYRPQRFQEVQGQEATVTTLKNALRLNRAGHAYLFCGSRGIGKTTLARLFAKALNCAHLSADCEPCNQCPSCLEILSGQSLDVIEIDGASNRGIDDIRKLNETVSYSPSHGKYKIYIIDEVHMLTKEAFNALLKTLEEPPGSAKFFFATTEIHKVPATILSRCQRFELQRLTEQQIADKLSEITRDLKREASTGAIRLIAAFAEGSLRDAESLFDQLLCFSDAPVSEEHVRHVLGLVPEEVFSRFDAAFSEGNIGHAFELVEWLFRQGKDLVHFTEQLIGHFRKLALGSSPVYAKEQLFFILDLSLATLVQLQKSTLQRVSLEALLVQILRSKHRIPLETLVRRLSQLEGKLLEAPPPPVAAAVAQNDPIQAVSPICTPLEKTPQPTPPPSEKTAIPPPSPPIESNQKPTVETSSTYPGRHETLLRFAAIELEGTLKK